MLKLPLAALCGAVLFVGFSKPAPRVVPGLDVLREQGGELLAGRRIGLITNHTGKTTDGVPAAKVLRDELGLAVVALFSPEHGFSGAVAAGDDVKTTTDTASGLRVYSLYGDARAPTREMLSNLDALVFDIQDVGVRFYTYISTLKLAMEAAASAGIDFFVLDRPNPNGGVRIEGPVLEPEFESFVGIAPIPLLHGMTVGELAGLFKASMANGSSLRLTVVPVRGWKREMSWAETGLPWRPPSPNIRTVASALAYPALGLFEGVNVSEGRGVEATFETAGAPWIESRRLVEALSKRGFPGVTFRRASFVPRSVDAAPHPKYRDQRCYGFEISITDPERFEAVRTGLGAIETIRALFPDAFAWVTREDRYWIDLLLGTDRPRKALQRGASVTEILDGEEDAVARFRVQREPHLRY